MKIAYLALAASTLLAIVGGAFGASLNSPELMVAYTVPGVVAIFVTMFIYH